MRYEHTQTGHVLIYGLFVAALAFGFARFFQTAPAREISFVISILLLITIGAFYKLTITIDGETLYGSFGIGLVRKKVALAEIASCEAIRIRWWYGWGIHLTPYGWLYNVAGWNAVAIMLRNGRRFALGTDDPQGLAAAIQAAIR
jgi:hypothetical protein